MNSKKRRAVERFPFTVKTIFYGSSCHCILGILGHYICRLIHPAMQSKENLFFCFYIRKRILKRGVLHFLAAYMGVYLRCV